MADLQKEFFRVQALCMQFENGDKNEDSEFYESLESLRKMIVEVQRQNIFSPNEELDEIDPHNLKFMLTPYYQADTILRIMENRKEKVELAKQFYLEYLKLLNHYQVLTPAERNEWKAYEVGEGIKFETSMTAQELRDFKVARFKGRREIEQKIALIKKSEDESQIKELYTSFIRFSAIRSLENLKFIELELEMLKIKEKEDIEKAKTTGQQQQPPPEKKALKLFHIPKGPVNNLPFLFSPDQHHHHHHHHNHDHKANLVQAYDPNMIPNRSVVNTDITDMDNRIDIRAQYGNQVFQPGYSQPLKTLDQFGEHFAGKLEANAKLEEEEKQWDSYVKSKEDEGYKNDEDRDDVTDPKTVKDRNWADWTDDHEKGGGNKNYNIK